MSNIYTKICIFNIYTEICISNRYSTKTWRSAQGTLLDLLQFLCGKRIQGKRYAVCVCHNWRRQQYNDNIKEQRHHFADKGPSSQSYGFSSSHIQIWELDHKESWTPKNWCFQAVELEKTLERVLWTARRSNQSILKEISPEYLLEGLIAKLKLQYFGHLMRRADSMEKTLMLGKIKGRWRDDRGWDGWMALLT